MSKIVSIKTKKRMLVKYRSDGEIEANGVEITKIRTVWYPRYSRDKSRQAHCLCEAVTHIN